MYLEASSSVFRIIESIIELGSITKNPKFILNSGIF